MPYRDLTFLELSLEAERERLLPLLHAAESFERIRPVRDVLTSLTAFLSIFTFLLAAVPTWAPTPWRAVFLGLHGAALLALLGSALREWHLRRTLARACKAHDARAGADCGMQGAERAS